MTTESNCSGMNSDLVTVHNQEENVYIQHRHNGERSWIGLNDRSVEGSFVWTNKEISSFRYWAPKQPNDRNNEDCVHTLGAKHGYTWNDVPCNNCFKFTCFRGNTSGISITGNCSIIKKSKKKKYCTGQNTRKKITNKLTSDRCLKILKITKF